MANGLFAGLTTLDILHLTERCPREDEKMLALDGLSIAGGPATNAALTFSSLGGEAHLVSSLGIHPLTSVIRDEFTRAGLSHFDTTPERESVPNLASAFVSRETGSRTLAGTVEKINLSVEDIDLGDRVQGADVILFDGHHIEVSLKIAREARDRGIPVVLDGGSWQDRIEELLEMTDVAICSEKFAAPSGNTGEGALEELRRLGVPIVVVTQGERPVLYSTENGSGEIPVPKVDVVDTLGAGDVFHGAFCYSYAHGSCSVEESLEYATDFASRSCQYFGPRKWAENLTNSD